VFVFTSFLPAILPGWVTGSSVGVPICIRWAQGTIPFPALTSAVLSGLDSAGGPGRRNTGCLPSRAPGWRLLASEPCSSRGVHGSVPGAEVPIQE
jgi:hypothetical protein